MTACLYAQQNGFKATGKQNVIIYANSGDAGISGATTSYYVTAKVSEKTPLTFLAALTGQINTIVSGTSTAGIITTPASDCVYVLDPSGSASLNASNGVTIQHATYGEMLERMKRCLRLNYAGAFHLDILPACPNGNLGAGAIVVPDCKLECWKHSNPKGLTAWFLLACQRREAIQERLFKASVEPLPSPVPSEFKYGRGAERLG